MKSIYGKLIIGFLVSILFSFSIAGYFSIRKNSDDLGRLAQEELKDSCDLIAYYLTEIDGPDLAKALNFYAESQDVSFFVDANNYKTLYGDHITGYELTPDQECKLRNHIGDTLILKNSSLRKVAKSFRIHGHDYIVYVQKDVERREMIFVDSAVIAVFCMLITGSITFLIIADIIVKPISLLNKATHELSKGNYRVRVNYTGNDEIARLNRSFNQMAQQLAKQEETRQQFISDVSHEFQTPLTAIQGFATILKNEKLTDEQRKKYADIIVFHSKRLSTLSKNMLQLTLLEGEDI